MSDNESEDCSPLEVLLRKHRKEKKELQAKIQGLKKASSKGDKKKKKEVMEEIAKLEAELDSRHEQEIAEIKNSSSDSQEVAQLSQALDSTEITEGAETTDQSTERVSKAQKRRERKGEKEKARQLDIDRQDEENKLGMRHLEAQKLKEILKRRHLSIHDITSDGDCLYNSVSHQLMLTTGVSQTVRQLRRNVADILRHNCDDFLPFLSNPKTGEPLSEVEYEKYCQDLTDKPVWGGQIELRALTQSLQLPIEVIQAEGRPVFIGEEFGGNPALVITYHRHYYGLGEHYNSTKPEKDEEEED